MAPLYRLADARYASLPDLKRGALSRQEVLDANDWLDAQDDAQDEMRERAAKAKQQ